jgi:hypothetical protein
MVTGLLSHSFLPSKRENLVCWLKEMKKNWESQIKHQEIQSNYTHLDSLQVFRLDLVIQRLGGAI